MRFLFFALFLLAMAAVFALMDRIVRSLAYPVGMRYLHSRMIAALLLVELVAANVFTISLPMQTVDAFINSSFLEPFLMTVMPNRAYELDYMILMLFGLNFLNALLIIVTLLITRLLFRKKTEFVCSDELHGAGLVLGLHWLLANHYYDEDNGVGRLNSNGFAASIWARGMHDAFALLWAVEILILAFSAFWGGEVWNEWVLNASKAWYLLPMAGYFMTEQVELFLYGGDISEIDAGSFVSSGVDSVLVGNVEALKNATEHYFKASGALLYTEDVDGSAFRGVGLGSNDVGNRQKEDCREPEILEFISRQLRESGVTLCDSYINALGELLNGESVSIRDQIEGEFLPYLAGYLNYNMSQGKTVLVLCPDKEKVKRVHAALSDKLSSLNMLCNVWTVCTADTLGSDTRANVLVCTSSELTEQFLIEGSPDFASDLFCVVFVDGLRVFSADGIHLELSLGKLRELGQLQYVVLSREENDSLRTAIERAIHVELDPFNNDSPPSKTHIMVWKEESSCRLQQCLNIGTTSGPYVGTALPLALVAIKGSMPQVHLITDPSRGDKTFDDMLTQSSQDAVTFLDQQVNFSDVIRYGPKEAMEPENITVSIAYDTDYNFFNAVWQWMKYGGRSGSLLHIVSPPYLLREYLAANAGPHRLLLKNNEFDALIPSEHGLQVTHMAVLLAALLNASMSEEELMSKSRQYGWNYESVEALLADCLKVVLAPGETGNVFISFQFREENTFDSEKRDFRRHTFVRLTDDTVRRRLSSQLAYARVVFNGKQSLQLTILQPNILNYYLRGQLAVFDGFVHRIKDIADNRIFATQENPADLPQYYPVSEFSFEDYELIDPCVDNGSLDFNLYRAKVFRRIYGYWSCLTGNDLTKSGTLFNKLSNNGNKIPEVCFDNVSVLEISCRRDDLGGRSTEAANLLAYTLAELSKTLFPASWQNLFVAVGAPENSDLYDRVLCNDSSCSLEDRIRSIIPKVKMPDRREDFVTVYVIEFSCVEYGMAQMLYQKWQAVFRIIQEYLHWYTGIPYSAAKAKTPGSATADDRETPSADAPGPAGSYLNFGADSIPSVFDAKDLLSLLDRVLPEMNNSAGPDKDAVIPGQYVCSFCYDSYAMIDVMSDGRYICRECKKHQASRKEVVSMYSDTIRQMKEGYGIEFSKKLHIKFQSAAKIREALGEDGDSGGRCLGFYYDAKKELWVETQGPRIAMQATLFHELTHAWQHAVLPLRKLSRALPKPKRKLLMLLLMEGHAMFVEIDAMRRLKHTQYADRLHKLTLSREDEYGAGYHLLYDRIRSKGEEGSHMNAFTAMRELVDDIIEGRLKYEDGTFKESESTE